MKSPYRITLEKYRKDKMLIDRCIFNSAEYTTASNLFEDLCKKYKQKHNLCFWFVTTHQIELLAWSKWLSN